MTDWRINLLIALAAAAVCVVGEVWHARRVRRVARLAFGPGGKARAWVRGVPVTRCAGAALACWGLLTLMSLDGAAAETDRSAPPDRHLLIALDVSPSMYIKDSGPARKTSRQHRGAEIMQSILDRLDMNQTKVTVVAFYSTARPVVVDTSDLNVVNNILSDLPLSHAFKDGKTNMYEGVKTAASIAERWRAGSATLVVVSDGDTLPETGRIAMPAAIGDVLVIGVGDPYRPSAVGEDLSRQDRHSLQRLAVQFRGVYHDGNEKHLPSNVLGDLTMLGLKDDRPPRMRTIAMAAVGTGAGLIGVISTLLAVFGLSAAGQQYSRAGRWERAIAKGATK